MLHYAGVFLVIALLAALFGFTGIAAGAVEIARVLFFVFIVLFIASFIAGWPRTRLPAVNSSTSVAPRFDFRA